MAAAAAVIAGDSGGALSMHALRWYVCSSVNVGEVTVSFGFFKASIDIPRAHHTTTHPRTHSYTHSRTHSHTHTHIHTQTSHISPEMKTGKSEAGSIHIISTKIEQNKPRSRLGGNCERILFSQPQRDCHLARCAPQKVSAAMQAFSQSKNQ